MGAKRGGTGHVGVTNGANGVRVDRAGCAVGGGAEPGLVPATSVAGAGTLEWEAVPGVAARQASADGQQEASAVEMVWVEGSRSVVGSRQAWRGLAEAWCLESAVGVVGPGLEGE